MFKRIPSNDWIGSSKEDNKENNDLPERFVIDKKLFYEIKDDPLQIKPDYIKATYYELRSILGDPIEPGGSNISSQWTIHDTLNETLINIFDWKATRLYSSTLPTVKDFRTSEKEYRWRMIGTKDSILSFSKWLESKLEKLHKK